MFAVQETLTMSKTFDKIHIPCWTTEYNKESFLNIIKKCDIIVTQPINDNYRDVDYLSTKFIINNSKPSCKIIICDSCHFDFYYFDLTYKIYDGNILHKPSDYHYNHMIECYNNNFSQDYYIETYVNNKNLKTSKELDSIAENSLNELVNRYNKNKEVYNGTNIHFITTYEFIRNNYKDKLLFYSMNHPSKYLIQYICQEIMNHLQIQSNINYNIDILNNIEQPLCILYKCIQKNVNFDINNCKPFLHGKNNIKDITQIYYDTYTNLGIKNL
jgi:hypothetical protein